MSSKILIANWKMNGTLDFCFSYFESLGKEVAPPMLPERARNIVFCAPFPYLFALQGRLLEKGYSLGGQDCAAYDAGAYTGEVSAAMLSDTGVSYVLVGHSERRSYLGESNEICRLKIQQAHDKGLTVIYCIGETLSQRKEGALENVLKEQIQDALPKSVTYENTLLAYEPVWAIGTGQTPTLEDIEETHMLIKALAGSHCKNYSARVLYGGSLNEKNAREILALSKVDGALVGGASLKPEKMAQIISLMPENV